MPFENTHLPCPCGKSSDAYASNKDGGGKCFSCGKFFPPEGDNSLINNTYQYLPWRGVNANTMAKYRTSTAVDPEGNPIEIGFRYPDESVKIRNLAEKTFYLKGDNKSKPNLFGADIFEPGGYSVVLTEGELDALSVHQMLGVPALSIKNGAQSATKDVGSYLEYLDKFERIYICFDNDVPGLEATQKVASLFNPLKVYIFKLHLFKDPNDYLTNNCIDEFIKSYRSAKRYIPDNVISSFSDIQEILKDKPKDPIATYPFKRLQDLTYGLFSGQAVLLKALEGIGKTEIIRAIEAHVLRTTDHNVGIIHLEENKARSIKGLASYVLDKPCHLPDTNTNEEEILEAYKKLCRRDDRLFMYSHFGSDDPNHILNTIRFLVTVCGCKLIFLDHISILVSGIEQDDERQKLDFISTRLKTLAEELDFALVFISHINDQGQTRGSRNISKIADTVIKLDRNLVAESEDERNTTWMTLEKNRMAGNTGPAGKLFFNKNTYQVIGVD